MNQRQAGLMRYPDTVILVFAKAPVAGKVNTRLIPDLGLAAATCLQDELLHHRLSTLADACLCDVVLYCAPSTYHVVFETCREHYQVRLAAQQGEGLGQRLLHGVDEAFRQYQHVILLGTDAPALEVIQIEQAITELHSGKDVVIVPAEDGGYVLAGVSGVHEQLFQDISWGTDQVMRQTLERISSMGLDHSVLESSWDIDRYEDYLRYRKQFGR
jgi:rSAM/selenodomain-associated transferase 1